MPSIRILLFVFAAITLSTMGASAQKPDQYSIPIEAHLYNPCCDEWIHFDLLVQGLFKHHDDNGGNHHIVWNERVSGTGVGENGNTYNLNLAYPETIRHDETSGTHTMIYRQSVRSSNNDCNFILMVTMKMTMTPSGEPAVIIEEIKVLCPGGESIE